MQVKKHNDSSCYVIAEAGINHNSDMSIAKDMIKMAARCGANAIKFQTIIPNEIFSELINPELYDMSKSWILDLKQHRELKNFAQKQKIDFLSTPLGTQSLKILKEIGCSTIKIASCDLNNTELLKHASDLKTKLIISTGMSTISEIASTVEYLKNKNCDFALLHCISCYPTPMDQANVRTVVFLKEMFDVPIGYSDHTMGTEASLAAVVLGASIIEKHFTLNKDMKGPDQKLSADPEEFSKMVNQIRSIEKSLGKPRTTVFPIEKKFRQNMRRSIVASKNLPKYSTLKKSDLILVRPGTGIPPTMLHNLIGMKTSKNIKKGELLDWKSL